MLMFASTSRPTLSLQSLASASVSKSESWSKAVDKKAVEAAVEAEAVEVVVRIDSTLLPTGDARERAADDGGRMGCTEGTGRAEAAATVESSGRISWEPPGLSTEERMLKRETEERIESDCRS